MSDTTPDLPRHFQRALGERIKERRRELQLTQVRLSALADISRAALANIEAGNQRTSVFLLARLAETLDVSPGELIPSLSEAQARLRRARRASVPAAGKTELLARELRKFNIAVEPQGGLQEALQEVRRRKRPRKPKEKTP